MSQTLPLSLVVYRALRPTWAMTEQIHPVVSERMDMVIFLRQLQQLKRWGFADSQACADDVASLMWRSL